MRQEALRGDVAYGVGISPHEGDVPFPRTDVWIVAGVDHDERNVHLGQVAQRRPCVWRMLGLRIDDTVDVPGEKFVHLPDQALRDCTLDSHVPTNTVRMEIAHQTVELPLSIWTRHVYGNDNALVLLLAHGWGL